MGKAFLKVACATRPGHLNSTPSSPQARSQMTLEPPTSWYQVQRGLAPNQPGPMYWISTHPDELRDHRYWPRSPGPGRQGSSGTPVSAESQLAPDKNTKIDPAKAFQQGRCGPPLWQNPPLVKYPHREASIHNFTSPCPTLSRPHMPRWMAIHGQRQPTPPPALPDVNSSKLKVTLFFGRYCFLYILSWTGYHSHDQSSLDSRV